MKPLSWLALALVAVLALGMYLHAAGIQSAQVNTDPERSDQSAYMSYARKLYESGFTYVGERNRMPLFPVLSTLVYREGMPEETFFLRGKWFNVGLSVLLLAGLFVVYRRQLPLHSATNLLAITAFSLFVFKAPCFQGELLYYTLSFVGFWLLSRILARPRPVLGLLAGAVLALAQYAKASALPSLGLFLGIALFSVLWERRNRMGGLAARLASLLREPLAVSGGLCLCVFLLILSPYLIHSKQQYGRFFYNVNTTFYMWYDSWEEVKQGTRAHGDRKGWPTMPEEEIPTPLRYLREHTLGDIARREMNGIRVVLRDRINSYGYTKYAVGALVLAAGLAVRRRDALRRHLSRYRWVALYWAAFLLGYFFMYSWWVPISPAPRFVLALFVPYMWAMSVTIDRLIVDLPPVSIAGRRAEPRMLLNVFVTAVVAIDAVLVVTGRIAQHYGCT